MAVSFNQMNSYPVAGQNLQKANNAQQAQIAAQTIVQDSFEKQTAQNVAQTPPNASFKGSSTSETKPLFLEGAAVGATSALGYIAGSYSGKYYTLNHSKPFLNEEGFLNKAGRELYLENLLKHEDSAKFIDNFDKFYSNFSKMKNNDEIIDLFVENVFVKNAEIRDGKVQGGWGLETAWNFFKEKSDTCLDDLNLKSIDELRSRAKKMVNALLADDIASGKIDCGKKLSLVFEQALLPNSFNFVKASDDLGYGKFAGGYGSAVKDTLNEFCKKPKLIWGAVGAAVLGGATMLYCYFKNKSAAPETQKLDTKV